MNQLLPVVSSLVCLLAIGAGAQAPPDRSRDQVKRKIADQMQRQDDHSLKLNAQVLIRLKNGERIKGLVKGGRFVERDEGLDFAEAEQKTPGAGIRIWYYDNTNSFIFIKYEHIESCAVLKRLTEVEVKEISDRMEADDKKNRERLAKIDAERIERLKSKGEDAAKEQSASKKLDELTKKEQDAEARKKAAEKNAALLKAFPPEDGWGPTKLRDIQVKKIAVGSFPDKKSREFVEVYDDWLVAYKVWEKEKEAGAADPASGQPAPSGAAPVEPGAASKTTRTGPPPMPNPVPGVTTFGQGPPPAPSGGPQPPPAPLPDPVPNPNGDPNGTGGENKGGEHKGG